MKKYYAVRKGRNPGIYETWEDCQKEIYRFSGAEYKSFTSFDDAKAFMDGTKKEVHSESEAVAYVDGSFLLEKAMFSYGAVLFYNGEELHFNEAFSDPELVSMRNVAGEIKGSEFIMRYCLEHGIKSIDIYYDYEGIEKWCTGAWRANKFGTRHYADTYKEISQYVDIHFIKVRGHSGDEYNDLADKLAKSALGIN